MIALKRLWTLLCALLLLPAAVLAELTWPEGATGGQQALQAYIARVNDSLAQLGSRQVNSIFECYAGFAVLGVTAKDMAEVPEGVELTFTMNEDSLSQLQLRVNDPACFTALAASCIQAASPEAMTLQDAMITPASHTARAQGEPANSYEEPVITGPGDAPRTYYAYYPNQYRDGVNWLQLTLIFPRSDAQAAAAIGAVTPPPADSEQEYEGTGYDGGIHLEVFVTPTPEPDPFGGE